MLGGPSSLFNSLPAVALLFLASISIGGTRTTRSVLLILAGLLSAQYAAISNSLDPSTPRFIKTKIDVEIETWSGKLQLESQKTIHFAAGWNECIKASQ